MPPHIYTEGLPEEPTPPYYNRTREDSQTYAPAQPTQQQIDAILRPLRPNSLRRYAAGYESWTGAEGMWIRTNYDAENEEAHQTLWNEYVDISQVIGPDSLVLEDEGLFAKERNSLARYIARVLERFPERVTNYSALEDVDWRENTLADFLRMREEAEGQTAGTRENESSFNSDDLCKTYWMYHAPCVVTHAFIEDAKAQWGGGVLHVFLDDCGNVVRQMRVDSNEVDNFDGAWSEGSWKDGWVYPGELGPAYQANGSSGLRGLLVATSQKIYQSLIAITMRY
ncbi:uncharacterized protein N7515_006733 [Penicillium bovifimosum]|uniref:Uncharacterized protein n=1 Tax=Penicillium bovifimosum TaxID=126998 RepID=A0A9W9GV82_9EURO|nr:uncharacterized protein N7515_006733 [Penicillium bovifimosum]KAJ5130694.1 hypothetical protein N7515_006733 [Penicillium bovifimosum]